MRPTNFNKRAVTRLVNFLKKGKIDMRSMRDVLKCSDVDVSPVEVFLSDQNDLVRRCASEVIGEKGSLVVLLEAAKSEEDKDVLLVMIDKLSKKSEKLEDLVHLLDSKDGVIREAAIQMFRRAGRNDCLIELLFDPSDVVMKRAKRWMEKNEND